jgi:hypothetical protein
MGEPNVGSNVKNFVKEKTSGTSPIYADAKGDPLTIQGYPVPPQDFDARFEYGFINIQKYSGDGKNNTGNVLLSLGYDYRLGKK